MKFLHVSPIYPFFDLFRDAFRWSEAGGVLAVLPSGTGRGVQDP